MADRLLVDAGIDGRASEWLEKGALTDLERQLCEAATAGRVLNLRTGEGADDDPIGGRRWGPQRTIRAVPLRQLLVGEESSAPRPIAVRVRGARIVGPLNLGGQALCCPLELMRAAGERVTEAVVALLSVVVVDGEARSDLRRAPLPWSSCLPSRDLSAGLW